MHRSDRLRLLTVAFFCSGAAALVFEVLWFRQASVLLGSSVVASSLVLASFMAGLVAGSLLGSRLAASNQNPTRLYALAEICAGLSGASLVLLFPKLSWIVSGLFGRFADHRLLLLDVARFSIAFGLLVVPTMAMGATLPILVEALSRQDEGFTEALSRLYGWNTLGAMVGAVATELVLIGNLGIRGSGLAAAGLDVVAAIIGLVVGRASVSASVVAHEPPATEPHPQVRRTRPSVLLCLAFLSGLLFLALEVVWFRALLLFVSGSSLAFALMLAVVLVGISIGGLLAKALAHLRDQTAALSALLFASGAVLVAAYGALPRVAGLWQGAYDESPWRLVALASTLMLPSALVSGAVFTTTGSALRAEGLPPARASGHLLAFNTLGGLFGSLLGALVLLPSLGMERSLLAAAVAYGTGGLAAAALALGSSRRSWSLTAIAAGSLALAVVAFPRGQMDRQILSMVARRFPGLRPVARRETVTETLTYLAAELDGHPVWYRLVTNGHSMSGSHDLDARYMKMFVYLPVALRPEPKQALLVCFGVGVTAQALTDTVSLRHLDVVDTSKDILGLSSVVFRGVGSNPLDDPRVIRHVEDGRFFLQTSGAAYDLITAEPPPPGLAGVVNLYTREFFALLKSRLAPAGLVSYWLPVHSLSRSDALSIVRSFCDVFTDCSLWSGTPIDWVLVGGRDRIKPPAPEGLAGQWKDPTVASRLKALGLDGPDLLGATFIADSVTLDEITRGALPLTDDHPQRLTGKPDPSEAAFFVALGNARASQRRFAESAFARAVWPREMWASTLGSFRIRELTESAIKSSGASLTPATLENLVLGLTRTEIHAPILWMLGTDARAVDVARSAAAAGSRHPEVLATLAAADVADRRYLAAEQRYSVLPDARSDEKVALRVALLALGGEKERAAALADSVSGRNAPMLGPDFRRFARDSLGLPVGAP